MQVEEPIDGAKVPAAQLVQAEARWAEYVPAAHKSLQATLRPIEEE